MACIVLENGYSKNVPHSMPKSHVFGLNICYVVYLDEVYMLTFSRNNELAMFSPLEQYYEGAYKVLYS